MENGKALYWIIGIVSTGLFGFLVVRKFIIVQNKEVVSFPPLSETENFPIFVKQQR